MIKRFPRRSILASAIAGFPALRLNGAGAPSDRVTVACVGTGWQGTNNVKSFLAEASAQVVAVCDIDRTHLAEARDIVNIKYGNGDCQTYTDFDEVFARKDIDAVVMSLPDHWHGVASTRALRAGKDVYGEKPIAHNFAEGKAIVDAVARYGRIWQTGSWQRSLTQFRLACELVRNGRIGKVSRVEVGLPGGHTDFDELGHLDSPQPPPSTLDYDRWLGPAPYAPYAPARVHKTWRWNFDYGGGMLLDWVGHHVDIAHWGLDMDDSGPVEVSGQGEFSAANRIWNTPVKFRVRARYSTGAEMLISGGHDDIRRGAKFIGDEGWIWVDRSGIEASRPHLLSGRLGGSDIRLYHSPGHFKNFLDCVRTRRPTVAPASAALRSATPAFLGLISIVTGRSIRWDPVAQSIVGDGDAARHLSRSMRGPWHL